ncbi:hypothetical protein JOC78_003025 [Bacillus ectoiniformans]|uniref:hypothetical protein n=1 Tax=Bacillus ectoiniformans TaxID=1494429 RepID=UPI0019599ACA|nr:hypothetical protein [Bacillus ectoiniformans]MBM7650041.1 hypothetical protein [Bacillus ectoiniformans]
MNGLIIGLACAGVILLIISLFQKDPAHQLKKEVDELSMQFLQETYQLKKKLKVIEEELLITDTVPNEKAYKAFSGQSGQINEIIKNQVISLYYQGTDMPNIARQSSLSLQQVQDILKPYQDKEEQ